MSPDNLMDQERKSAGAGAASLGELLAAKGPDWTECGCGRVPQ
jgi:hypothetical protein